MSCFSLQDIGGCGCSCIIGADIRGCNSLPVGEGVTVNFKQGGVTIYTADTDADGLAYLTGTAGTYDIEVIDNRTPSRWETELYEGVDVACTEFPVLDLPVLDVTTPKAGFTCSSLCGDPLSNTLSLTDPNGTWTLTYNGLHGLGAGWYGCANKAGMVNVVTSLPAGVCTPATTGTATVNYAPCLTVAGSVITYYGYYQPPGQQRTSSTQTCSAGVLNLNAGIPASCIGSIALASATSSPSVECPPSLSLTGTQPATGTATTADPASGAYTITE